MEVKDLKPKQGNVELELDIVDVSPSREFEKFGKKGKVANAIGKDGTGDIKLTLWNEQADMVKAGDRIKITNGYVSEWQGEMQLGTGRFGKLDVISESQAAEKPENKEGKTQEGQSEKPAQSKKQPEEPDEAEINLDDDIVVEEEDIE